MAAKKCIVCGTSYGPEVVFCATDGAKLRDEGEVDAIRGDADPFVGALVGGRYRILKRIGEGGMGVVYLAEHEAIEKRVAIKVLKEQYAQREDVVARFQQEAKSASRVKHEGVLEVFDFGRTDDHRFFLAMELLDGVDLAHVLERETLLAPSRAVRMGVQIGRALGAAHAKGIVHRDLKPENVFVRVGDDGREHVKIVDFGIAQLRAEGEEATDPNAKVQGRKLTKTGMIFGTPEYMSPEQASGKPIDGRVDVYALGVILFELLTGKTPFQGETFMAILSAHLMHEIPTLSERAPLGFECSRDLEAVVRRALAKDPDQRFRSMGELVEALLATPEALVDDALRPAAPRFSSQFPSGLAKDPVPIAATDLRIGAPPRISVAPPGARQFDPSAATIMGDEAAARPSQASTEATTAPVVPKKSGGATLFVVAALALVGAGGFFALRGDAGSNAEATPPKPAPAASSPTPTNVSAAGPSASAAPSTGAGEPAHVAIHVESTPSGAIVEREVGQHWVQVCDATPCDVRVPAGTTVHLRATKAGQSAEKRLLAENDQKAVLTLVAPAAAPKPPSSPKPPGENLCEVLLEEGIKVWRPCK